MSSPRAAISSTCPPVPPRLILPTMSIPRSATAAAAPKSTGKLVTLDYVLKTGDMVEILTAKHGGPSRDWLNANLKLVNTQRARAKIRAWFKEQDREQNLTQGKVVLERELRRLGMEMEPEDLAHTFDFRTPKKICMSRLAAAIFQSAGSSTKLSDLNKEKQDPLLVSSAALRDKIVSGDNSVTVVGLKGMLTTFARCCKPVPGDEIVGYITRGRGVTIHRQDCPNILRLDDHERIIKVSWGAAPKTYPVPVVIKAYDRHGSDGRYFERSQRRKHQYPGCQPESQPSPGCA